MVYEKLGVHAEELVEQVLVSACVSPGDRCPCDFPHRTQPHLVELAGRGTPHPPEVREGTMVPEQATIAHLVELGDARAICAGGQVLGDDVHRDLGEVEIGADADGCRDARLREHVAHEHGGELMGRHGCRAQVARHVDEDFVDGVDVYVLGCHVAQVDFVDFGAALQVEGHARLRDDVIEGQLGMEVKFLGVARGAREPMARRLGLAPGIDGLDRLDDLEQAWPARNAVGLEGRRDGEAYGLLGAALVRHDEVGGERIEAALGAFDRCVERLEVNGDVGPLLVVSLFHGMGV